MTDKPDDGRAAMDLERSYQALEIYGVSRSRSKSVSNGIEVLATRYRREIHDLSASNANLAAENAKLKGDAERYRWLRKGNRMLTITIEQWGKHRSTLHGEHADAAIDAAIGG